MKFGIIAAGEGSRLADEGVATPKPLVRLDGEPMIGRLIRIFCECGAESVSVVVNGNMPEVKAYLETLSKSIETDLRVEERVTPSSMHTFWELSQIIGRDGRFITTTVDTIFREDDFHRYVEAYSRAGEDVDGMMAVTDYIEDEKPLYVGVGADREIAAFSDTPVAGEETQYISAGIYGLGSRAIDVLAGCMDRGVSRMRNYQRALLEAGLRLEAFPLGKVIDVDHAGDIARAIELIAK